MASLKLLALQPQRLEPVNLEIGAGELAFLCGPSGSGKSLLLRAIADLDPNAGEVLLDGQPRSSMPAPAWRRRVGLMPAESGWWADRVGAHFPEGPPERDHTDVIQALHLWLAQLGFGTDVLDWDIQRLSTGERQRLALVRLLCRKPEALLLDEATANLDPTNRERAERLIGNYRTERRAAVFWASHDPEQRQRLSGPTGAQRLVIADGQLLLERPRSRGPGR